MERFIADNPGVAIAIGGLLLAIISMLAGSVAYFWKRSQGQEAKAWQAAVEGIKEGLHDVRDSIDKSVERFEQTFKDVFGRLGSAEKEISHIKGRCELHTRGKVWPPQN